MSSKSESSSGGIGFCGLLAVVFITLKLLGKITWSWWWVLSPLWIGFIAFLVIFVIGLIAIVAIQAAKRS